MHPAIRALLVVALLPPLALAGCAAVVPGDGTDTPETIAPGVTERGLTDASALADAHERVIRRDSVTVNRTLVQRVDRGTYTFQIEHDETIRIGPDWETFHATDRVTGDGRNGPFAYTREVYGDGEWLLVRTANGSGVTYERYGAGEFPYGAENVTYVSHVRGLRGGNLTGTLNESGTTFYRLRYERRAGPGKGEWNESTTALVSESGYVKRIDSRLAGERQPGHVDQTLHVEWGEWGETSVERPDWADEALAATDERTTNVTDER